MYFCWPPREAGLSISTLIYIQALGNIFPIYALLNDRRSPK